MFKKKEQQGLQIRSARSSWGKNTEHYSFSGSQKCSLKHSSKSQSYKTRDVSDCKVPLENTGGKKIRFNYEVFLPAKQQTGLCIHSSVKSCCIFWLDHSSHVNSQGMCLSQFLTAPNAFHFLVNLRNLPSSLPYSLQNNLVGFCFLLTTYLNLFTLIPTATLIEQLTPCVPHDHIFSLLYSLAPHTPSTLCYLPPPPPHASRLPLFSTHRCLIQSQAMLFMKRHFIFQNHLCLRCCAGSITSHQSERRGSVFESKPKFPIEYILAHNHTRPHEYRAFSI